jgi:hypothetical protein
MTMDSVANDTAIDHPPLTRLEERFRDHGEPPFLFSSSADPDEATVADEGPTEADRAWNDDRGRWVATWGALCPSRLYPGPGRWSADYPAPDSHWAYSGLQDSIVVSPTSPTPADVVALVPFIHEDAFSDWLRAVAAEIRDFHSERCRWLSSEIAKAARLADYFGATTPAEFDARLAENERWQAERAAGGGHHVEG